MMVSSINHIYLSIYYCMQEKSIMMLLKLFIIPLHASRWLVSPPQGELHCWSTGSTTYHHSTKLPTPGTPVGPKQLGAFGIEWQPAMHGPSAYSRILYWYYYQYTTVESQHLRKWSKRLLPRCYAPAGQTWENFNPPGPMLCNGIGLRSRSLGCRYGFSLQKDILNES